MEKCGANLLSCSSWDVDPGIAIQQQAYKVRRGRSDAAMSYSSSNIDLQKVKNDGSSWINNVPPDITKMYMLPAIDTAPFIC